MKTQTKAKTRSLISWTISIALVGAALYVLLFWPRSVAVDQPPADQEEVMDEYLELIEERNRLQKELLELEILKWKLENGKAWSA